MRRNGLTIALGLFLVTLLQGNEPELPSGAAKRYGDLRFRTAWPIRGVALSPTGKLVAASTNEEVFLWAAPSGRLVGRHSGVLPGPDSFSPDGKKLVILEPEKDYNPHRWPRTGWGRVLDPESGKTLFAVGRDKADITCVTWVGQGAILALGTADGAVNLVDGATGKPVGRLEAPELPGAPIARSVGPVNLLAISPDGKTAAVLYFQGQLARLGIWDFAARKLRLLSTQPIGEKYHALTIASDNRTLRLTAETLTAGSSQVFTFDLDKLDPSFKPLSAQSTSLCYQDAGIFSGDGEQYAQAATSQTQNSKLQTDVFVWNLAKGNSTRIGSTMGGLLALAFAADGKTLVTGNEDGMVQLWNVESGKVLEVASDHTAAILSLAVSPDQRLIATGSKDRSIRIREIATGKIVQVLQGPMEEVTGLLFLPDGKTLVSRSREAPDRNFYRTSTLRLWDYLQGKQSAEFVVPRADTPLACTTDGKYLAFAQGCNASIIDLAARKAVEPPYGAYADELQPRLRFYVRRDREYSNPVSSTGFPAIKEKMARAEQGFNMRWHCAAFHPDGAMLVSGLGHRLALVDPASGQEKRRLNPVSDPAPQANAPHYRHVLFTPDGKRVIALQDVRPYAIPPQAFQFELPNGDQEIQVWDVASGRRLATFRGQAGSFYDLALAENGRALFTAGADGSVLLWDLEAVSTPESSSSDLEGLAGRMFGQDEFAAVQAMQALVGDPAKAAAVIQAWSSNAPPNATVEKLVSQLASKELVQRLQAIQALTEMRDKKDTTVETYLIRAALKPDADETARLCALTLLESYHDPSTREYVNLLRTIKLSEWLADQSAKDRLKLYGERLPTARGGKTAREALKRIETGTHRKDFDALPPLPKAGAATHKRQPLRILQPPEPKP